MIVMRRQIDKSFKKCYVPDFRNVPQIDWRSALYYPKSGYTKDIKKSTTDPFLCHCCDCAIVAWEKIFSSSALCSFYYIFQADRPTNVFSFFPRLTTYRFDVASFRVIIKCRNSVYWLERNISDKNDIQNMNWAKDRIVQNISC